MDVLKDVKNAEAEAERIEADYQKRADDLLASLSTKLEQARAQKVAAVEDELRAYRDSLSQRLAEEKRKVQQEGERELETLGKESTSNRDAAVAALLSKLGAG